MNKQIEVLIDKYGLTHLKRGTYEYCISLYKSCAKAGGNSSDR